MSGYSVYAKNVTVTDNPRALEYRLLGQVTAALLDANRKDAEKPKLIDALLWNKNVWDHFMLDLQDEGNRLPKETKSALIGIDIWVNRETSRVMEGATDCDGLIEINQIIMEGLK
ncbi:MAG: flagellar biosynthesis regulatory protein FlaF [Alphaproteobacteria bacterium]|nr:flagellar biosynthesis regulatory protein FlaF [Alphaproteobacteria bacterium]